MTSSTWIELVGHDVRRAIKRLRRSLGFTTVALLCVTLGVGVTATIFGAVNGILLKPLPFSRDTEIIAIHARNLAHDVRGSRVSWADFASWRAQAHTLARAGIYSTGFQQLTGPEGPVERVEGAAISASLFPLLGLQPFLGRNFVPADEAPGRDPVVILGYGLWQRRFGGDRDILHRRIQLRGQLCTVVGVMPPAAGFPEGTEIWTPASVVEADEEHGNRRFAGALARMKPGVTLEQAQADLAAISRRLTTEFPRDNAGWDAEAVLLRDDLVGALRRPLLVFLGAALVVLLIAAANVGNLMLARGTLARRDLAIAAALGATRFRIIRELLAESVLLALVGGAAGTVAAFMGLRLIALTFPGGVPSYLTLSVDGAVAAFAMVVSVATALLFGVVPAMRATSASLASALHEAGRGADQRAGGRRLRAALVSGEIALSVVLAVAAMLLVQSDWVLEREMGIDPRGVLTARVPLPAPKYEGARRLDFYEQLFTRIRALRGVTAVGSSQGLPFGPTNGSADRVNVIIDGRPAAQAGEATALRLDVSVGYLQTVGTPLVQGRGFTQADYRPDMRAGIVNAAFVRRYSAGANPLGMRLRFVEEEPGAPWITVVGVARDARQERPPQPVAPLVYVPFTQAGQTLVVRTTLANPLALGPDIRAVVRQMDPTLPVYLVQTLDQIVEGTLWRQRLQGRVLAIFGALAVLLALVGVYGVISYAVAERTREMAVRMALGASAAQVMRLVLAQGARLAATGLAVGVAGALAMTRVVASLLYGVGARDPATFIGVSVGLAAVSLLAATGPARRAARVDPMVAMYSE